MRPKKIKYKSEQEKLKNWYKKQFYWVFKKECSVCGSEFYTLWDNQVVCNCKDCKTKQEATNHEIVPTDGLTPLRLYFDET